MFIMDVIIDRRYKITSTDIVDRDDLYLKIYGTNRNESLKQQVLKQLEEQQSKLFTKQKNIYQFSDKLNRLSWQRTIVKTFYYLVQIG